MTQPTPERAPELTRTEMDERLLDYLYGELEPAAKAAFERALPAFPEVQAELDRHQWTRQKMAELPVVPLPAGALEAALTAADQHVAGLQASAAKPGFWARLAALVRQPAFAMAMVAVLGVGVGLMMARKGELPGSDLSAGERAGVAPAPQPDKPAVPAVEVERYAATKEPAKAEQPTGIAAAPDPSLAAKLPDPAAPAAAAEPATIGSVGDNEAKKGELERAREAGAAQGAGGEAGVWNAGRIPEAKPATPVARAKEAGGFGFEGEAPAEVVSGLVQPTDGRAGLDDLSKVGDATTGSTERGPGAPAGVANTPPPDLAQPVVKADVYKEEAELAADAASESRSKDVAIDEDAKAKTSAPRMTSPPAEKTVTEKPADRPADRTVANAPPQSAPNATNTPPAPTRADTKPAADKPPPPPTEAQLWTVYQQQIAAGALTDAQKTLADLQKLIGETAKLKNAREDLARRTSDAVKAEAARNAPAKPMPEPNTAPVPGKNQ